MENKKITNLEELINQTKQNLKDTGYSSTSLCVHGKIWRELSEYLSSKGIASYAPVNGLDYLHYKINYPEILERTLTHDERDFIRAIRFLNEYQENGAIPSALPRRRINRNFLMQPVKWNALKKGGKFSICFFHCSYVRGYGLGKR